jgi:hypothetical protein
VINLVVYAQTAVSIHLKIEMRKILNQMRIIPPFILVLFGSFVLQGQFTITIREICEETSCTNGKDDDGDGFIDCLDDECFDKNPCRCLKSNQKNSNWDLIANPPVSCDSQNDTITVSINGLDSVPNTERRVIWSNGELDVYSITLIPADLDSPFIEVRIIEQDQCEEVKRIDISTSIITFDLTTSWNMGDSLWCNNWTDSTVLSVDNISSGNMHEIVWSTGDNTLDITYFPN